MSKVAKQNDYCTCLLYQLHWLWTEWLLHLSLVPIALTVNRMIIAPVSCTNSTDCEQNDYRTCLLYQLHWLWTEWLLHLSLVPIALTVNRMILIPFWLIIMWDCTALKMHLTQKMYVIYTWDWQQNLTYVWYVAPSTHKSTLTCCYAPPTIYWLKGTRSLTSVYK